MVLNTLDEFTSWESDVVKDLGVHSLLLRRTMILNDLSMVLYGFMILSTINQEVIMMPAWWTRSCLLEDPSEEVQ